MKTLKITEELHKKIKIFCATNGLKINDWVEKELEKLLNRNDTDKRN
jgi:predicted HicB family RNase H-like nuclease